SAERVAADGEVRAYSLQRKAVAVERVNDPPLPAELFRFCAELRGEPVVEDAHRVEEIRDVVPMPHHVRRRLGGDYEIVRVDIEGVAAELARQDAIEGRLVDENVDQLDVV